MSELQKLIDLLELQPHPEGGYYKETYRSTGVISANNPAWEFSSDRNFSTCIYFLLTSEAFSAFHRIGQDEIWHFYKGAPIRLHLIDGDGIHSEVLIGADLEKGQQPQFVVPAGCWFAAEVVEPDAYGLVGCTVSPGFDFADFELASRTGLIDQYPELSDLINKFTPI